MMELFAQIASSRLDWFDFGISSANRTGAFVACVSLAFWILCAFRPKAFFWVSLPGSALFLFFLVQTQSRGGILAWLAGMGAILLFGKIPIGKFRAGALIIILFAAAIARHSGCKERVETLVTMECSSAALRADMYLAGMKMFTDAPEGCFAERPVDMYMSFYQNDNSDALYLSMLNSHFEFMLPYSWEVRFLYIMAWAFALAVSFPCRRNTANAVCFAVTLCFALSMCFSHVANYWVLWIIPLCALALSLVLNRSRLFSLKFYLAFLGLSALAAALLCAISILLPRDADLRFHEGRTLVGSGRQKSLIFKPDVKVLGKQYGRELAMFAKDDGETQIIIGAPDGGGGEYEALVLSGGFAFSEISKIGAKRFVFLNACPADAEPADMAGFIRKHPSEVRVGELGDWRVKMFWKSVLELEPGADIGFSAGVGHYIPDWTFTLKGKEND